MCFCFLFFFYYYAMSLWCQEKLFDQFWNYQRTTSGHINIFFCIWRSFQSMTVLFLVDLYPKLVVLAWGLNKSCMHELRVGKGFCLHWKPMIFCTAFWDPRFSLFYLVSFMFSENTVLGIGRMPRSLKIGIEAARLLERIADFWSFVSLELRVKDWPHTWIA